MKSKDRTLMHQDWYLFQRKKHYKDIGIEQWQEKTQQEDTHLQGQEASSSSLLNFSLQNHGKTKYLLLEPPNPWYLAMAVLAD